MDVFCFLFFVLRQAVNELRLACVVLLLWKTPRWLAIPMLLGFLLVDSLYFTANAPKIFQGGAFPVIAGIGLFISKTTGNEGGKSPSSGWTRPHCLCRCSSAAFVSNPPYRVQGTAFFLTARADAAPHALLHNLLHNQVLHEQVVLLTVVSEDSARVTANRRFEVEAYGEGFFRASLYFGFMEEPHVSSDAEKMLYVG
ncbi:KUP/HAK/KT family potassium transporter [Pseudomonas sp. UYIF39]|uniref:KUP/HAK/KT family potassium transporter n=1 Tax=Pseudomonas sp. UYIF39 TaxID=1630747 RepID=UPI00249F3C5C|nr:KUP/HAK/KT family potassium transporter [Pseudomonas sp. UYIF39]MDI3352880.1 KUP/HAK/KT family potassium transporter [Pseudomonas sp. UYIF39]